MPREVRPVSAEQLALRDRLIDAGLLVPSTIDGVYGHGETFEAVREALERVISAAAAAGGARRLRFPPVIPVRQLEDTGYLSNMPHLAGTVFAFAGDDGAAAEQAARAAAHADWSEFQSPTELALTPAACYPVYPALARGGPLPAGGAFIDAGGSWVYRHEPSLDPARRQMFHQHELVRAGEPDTVVAWRGEWAQRGITLLGELGLDARLDRANDPFFGRRGRMLAANQRAQDLKLELLVDIAGPEATACASFNHHQGHFADTFGVTMADGSPAHTACLGFGHERIVLALFARHGLDPADWPAAVHARLGTGA
ncbi:MAG TPA: amino acid--[acyl-carrier-protein] ligase [Solirubrobacteraceae bacterium]|nr:amino acid--[acyl-carrier-protein] ligase [Solirubrobacteraceae bacterium]